MTVNEVLTPIILEEFERHKKNGRKIRLRSVGRRRLIYSLIFPLASVILANAHPIFFFILSGIYLILMLKTKHVRTIIALCKKSPDTPISEIIERELK